MSKLTRITTAAPRRVRELAVISGKGGTGKTSIVASLAALSRTSALADCDVDAADLHLVLEPRILQRSEFVGGKSARIQPSHCIACGQCADLCRFDAIRFDGPGNGSVERTFRVDPGACEGCGVCAWFCAGQAIEFGPVVNGEWFISETRCGPMVHARLGIAAENSGKLVSIVRTNASRIAEERGLDLVLVDGSPGIGCPVIASLTGATLALAVTEPTLSGLHDLERVVELTRHFGISTLICVNKWDINPEVCGHIENWARRNCLALAGRVRYDAAFTAAQIRGVAAVEVRQDGCASDLRAVWTTVEAHLNRSAWHAGDGP